MIPLLHEFSLQSRDHLMVQPDNCNKIPQHHMNGTSNEPSQIKYTPINCHDHMDESFQSNPTKVGKSRKATLFPLVTSRHATDDCIDDMLKRVSHHKTSSLKTE